MLILAQLAIGATLFAQSAPTDGYMNHDALTQAVGNLASGSADVTATTIGTSIEGRDIHLVTLSGDAGAGESRPALLIVAGVDARHLVGTETAIRVARRIVFDHPDLLDDFTVYVVPRVNPDGAERKFGSVLNGARGNARSVDDDRDGAMDEDPPADLNGDGMITTMRRASPPLDEPATHLPDPDEPRLMKTPDRDEGESATYVMYVEGRDADGDGRVAEDGPGVTDLDRNFMHEYDDHALDGGAYPLSEPETLALAKFVIEHRNIVAAIVYGRHDNVINVPDGQGSDASGEGPKNIHSGDVDLYKAISEVYEESTGQTNAPQEDADGSLHAWLYAQRGIPTFATVVWGRPEVEDAAEDGGEGGEPGGAGGGEGFDPSGEWTGTMSMPDFGQDVPTSITVARGEGEGITATMDTMGNSMELTGSYGNGSGTLTGELDFGGQTIQVNLTLDGGSMSGSLSGPEGMSATITAKHPSGGGGGATGATSGGAADPDAAAWLAYSDDARGGAGFIDWQPFNHPDLGAVEIGGFVPLFTMNPPIDEVDDLAAKQLDFALKVMERRPMLRVVGPEVSKLANGLYDVRIAVVNDGEFPTRTQQARRTRTTLPTIVRISTPVEGIITGDRVTREWGLDGKGGRIDRHWVIRAEPGDEVTFTIHNEQLGEQTISFTAE